MVEIIPNWHPIFVHFTVGLISISFFSYVLGYVFKDTTLGHELLIVGRWCLWFGFLITIATVTAGFIAYYSVNHDGPAHEVMTIHRNWAIATLSMIALMSAWSFWTYMKGQAVSILFLTGMLIAFLLVLVTAWHGAELVFRHGVGVMSLPGQSQTRPTEPAEQTESSHQHGQHEH